MKIKELLKALYICKKSKHIPNKATRKAITDAKEGKGLTKYKSLEDFFKKMGI